MCALLSGLTEVHSGIAPSGLPQELLVAITAQKAVVFACAVVREMRSQALLFFFLRKEFAFETCLWGSVVPPGSSGAHQR